MSGAPYWVKVARLRVSWAGLQVEKAFMAKSVMVFLRFIGAAPVVDGYKYFYARNKKKRAAEMENRPRRSA